MGVCQKGDIFFKKNSNKHTILPGQGQRTRASSCPPLSMVEFVPVVRSCMSVRSPVLLEWEQRQVESEGPDHRRSIHPKLFCSLKLRSSVYKIFFQFSENVSIFCIFTVQKK